jgi:hypothetical protein
MQTRTKNIAMRIVEKRIIRILTVGLLFVLGGPDVRDGHAAIAHELTCVLCSPEAGMQRGAPATSFCESVQEDKAQCYQNAGANSGTRLSLGKVHRGVVRRGRNTYSNSQSSVDSCPDVEYGEPGGGRDVWFAKTLGGRWGYGRCPEGQSGIVRKYCGHDGLWDDSGAYDEVSSGPGYNERVEAGIYRLPKERTEDTNVLETLRNEYSMCFYPPTKLDLAELVDNDERAMKNLVVDQSYGSFTWTDDDGTTQGENWSAVLGYPWASDGGIGHVGGDPKTDINPRWIQIRITRPGPNSEPAIVTGIKIKFKDFKVPEDECGHYRGGNSLGVTWRWNPRDCLYIRLL